MLEHPLQGVEAVIALIHANHNHLLRHCRTKTETRENCRPAPLQWRGSYKRNPRKKMELEEERLWRRNRL